MSTEEPVKVPFFKKGKSRPTTARRQKSSSPPSSFPSTSKSQVILPTKKNANNLLSAGTKRKRGEDSGANDDDDEPEKDGPDVKWSSEGSHITAAREIIAGDELEELMFKRRIKEKEGIDDDIIPNDGQYHGQSAYKSHIQKNKEVPKAMRVGPQRGTSTIRTVTIIDYQPDVCKDYKETGYCGFGDTCKFLHDRGTYLAGWQLDKLAENSSKRAQDDDTSSGSDSDDEDIPFACLICRKPYTDPVVTRCGHYFCSACAIKRFAKTPKCLACGASTGGMFNRADKVIEKINKKRKEKEDAEADKDDENKVEIEGLDTHGSDGDERSNHSDESE